MELSGAQLRPVGQSSLARLALILVAPRRTMREILGNPRDRSVWFLVLFAIVSTIVKELNIPELQQGLRNAPPMFPLILAGILVAFALVAFLLFHAFSWIAVGIGRVLEGTGSVRAVRSAVAWGLTPFIWAFIYRIPLAFSRTSAPKSESFFTPGSLAPEGWLVALLPLFLEFVTFCLYLFVASSTLAEAHGFSGWRGLGTLLLSLASPAILVIAAVLTVVV